MQRGSRLLVLVYGTPMFRKVMTEVQRRRLDPSGTVALGEPKQGSETGYKALSPKPPEATRSFSRAPKGHT